MSAIFISYRRDDSAAYVGRMYDVLVQQFGRDRVFLDIDAIGPGEDFREVVERTLAASSVVLAVIGRQWVSITDRTGRVRLQSQMDTLRVEISSALARTGVKVIPVLVGGAGMPEESALPADLQALSYRNAVEVSDKRFHYDMEELVKALTKILGNGKLPLPFTLNGITLGRSNFTELAAKGYMMKRADPKEWQSRTFPIDDVDGIRFFYSNKTGIVNRALFWNHEGSADFPASWRKLGFDKSKSYDEWTQTLEQLGYTLEFGRIGFLAGCDTHTLELEFQVHLSRNNTVIPHRGPSSLASFSVSVEE